MTEKLNKLLSQQKKLQKKIEQKETTLRQSFFENAKKRKERTRLLIQKGALLDKYFESNHLSIVETEELLKIFANYVNVNKPDQYKKKKSND
ncbi:hypothetical protein [Leuconostoc mesenteroides]|uniref:hypothetical protein n=1 Tax=Leuconostoc mesenteroides TaxID=1245 RepID=UPI00235FC0DA|nr:hypothetical protein [Leuconostoc mesenteroides]